MYRKYVFKVIKVDGEREREGGRGERERERVRGVVALNNGTSKKHSCTLCLPQGSGLEMTQISTEMGVD